MSGGRALPPALSQWSAVSGLPVNIYIYIYIHEPAMWLLQKSPASAVTRLNIGAVPCTSYVRWYMAAAGYSSMRLDRGWPATDFPPQPCSGYNSNHSLHRHRLQSRNGNCYAEWPGHLVTFLSEILKILNSSLYSLWSLKLLFLNEEHAHQWYFFFHDAIDVWSVMFYDFLIS